MRPELSNKLKNDFPGLYGHLDYGFDCLEGWFDILYKLSQDILKAAEEHNIPIGLDDENSGLYARQVKEKFGTLRYYTSYSWRVVDKIIHDVEYESSKTCENCGRPGRLICEQHWYMVRCIKCIDEMRQTPHPN